MKKALLTTLFVFVSIHSLVIAQVSNIYGAWIEVHPLNDSLEVRLMLLSKQGALLPMSQTVSLFDIAANGTVSALPPIQLDRLNSGDSAQLRFSVFRKKIPIRNTATLFAWNACCRGALLNGSTTASNESMVAFTRVFPESMNGNLLASTRITAFPTMNYTRGVSQSAVLTWQNPVANTTTTVGISEPIAALVNGQPQAVSGTRLPLSSELLLNGNELTVLAPEAGNLAFNLQYQTNTMVNGTSFLLSHIEAAFQINIEQASSLRNLYDEAAQGPLEVYDMLGRLVEKTTEKPTLKAGTYLFKRGNRIEKVMIF
ncbi:MAG: hypothetical protein C0424_01680 [Sphingobacteriaceae bacterium]|nr:hypothetical protein [Sphingobacteriaceae bacterium]